MAERFAEVRDFSLQLCAPLETEDYVVQSMPDVSPTRWHLAHTTWFFESFLLSPAGITPFNNQYEFLFNSYYNAIGEQFPRAQRGLLTRPTVEEVVEYRRVIDDRVLGLIEKADGSQWDRLGELLLLGLQHEQQHQELMLTDIKHVFSCNPLEPAYRPAHQPSGCRRPPQLGWVEYDAGLECIGYEGDGFCYDNERPRHRTYLERRQLATRPVTNQEYQEFIEDNGYRRPELWLSSGWAYLQERRVEAPLYWQRTPGGWAQFTLGGVMPLAAHEPVCHVSYFEADAFARWSGSRLPTEAEWEVAACSQSVAGNFVELEAFHPCCADSEQAAGGGLLQLFGDVWEWTASPYVAYPGYQPLAGAVGEYNGKFMCNQFVLRGGSCATSLSHIRATYRNFFPPDARWQFTGIRLAR